MRKKKITECVSRLSISPILPRFVQEFLKLTVKNKNLELIFWTVAAWKGTWNPNLRTNNSSQGCYPLPAPNELLFSLRPWAPLVTVFIYQCLLYVKSVLGSGTRRAGKRANNSLSSWSLHFRGRKKDGDE